MYVHLVCAGVTMLLFLLLLTDWMLSFIILSSFWFEQFVMDSTIFPSGNILDLCLSTNSEIVGFCKVLAPLPGCFYEPVIVSYVFRDLPGPLIICCLWCLINYGLEVGTTL